jgi:hypothetical protein
MRRVAVRTSVLVMIAAAACAPGADGTDDRPAATAPQSAPGSADSGTAADSADVAGTIVRFTSESVSVDVTIDQDSPAARDFVAMPPLTLEVEGFSGREKIAYLPEELDHEGTPGSDPEDGDLIYFVPWGNLGFYYDTEGVGYSDQTLHLGAYEAPLETLEALEGEVTVTAVT